MKSKEQSQEVELRAILTTTQWESIRLRLTSEYKFLREERLTDVYFCKKEVNSFDELEMVEIGSYSLRLRKTEIDGTINVDLNTKVITHTNDHNSWKEHEVVIQSFDDMSSILDVVGFKSFFTLSKTRLTYKKDDFTVVLENIDNFGPIIEVEILTNIDSSENAKTQIRQLLYDFGLTDEQIVVKSVTNLIMKKLVRL